MSEPETVACIDCGAPAQIHESDLDEDHRADWCLDHAPERYADDVVRMRAVGKFISEWAAWLEGREEAGEPTPSWRVTASSAFSAGIRFAEERHAASAGTA